MSQEIFYPINTPLINYFFYKAPFVSNSFVLTDFFVFDGGSGYKVNDVIVAQGGTYTSPAVFQVKSVDISGAITSAIITNNGKYTLTPNLFYQAYTNGLGNGMIISSLVFSANILPSGVNIPLSGGFIYFYADEDHTIQLPTYSDISDPNNPVINTDPIQLGASGECPLFYLQDRLYYIVITDYTGDQSNPVHTVQHYNPADQSAITGAFNNNFVANPQFNYPIEFWKLTDDVGEIDLPSTFVAWGCEFLQDLNTNTENVVTFNPVSGLEIEGHPVNELVLDSDDVSSSETIKDFRWKIGAVDINAEGNMTFSAQMMSKTSQNISTILFIERFYGTNGSLTEIIPLDTFTVTPTRQKFVFSFVLPTIIGKVIDEGNYLAIRLQPGLKTVCTFGITNVMVLPGNVANPIFADESQGFAKSQILGVSTDINDAGLPENYSPYYYADGKIFPLADTGAIVLGTNNWIQKFREKADGTTRLVNNYSPNNIPYRRLYNVIGNTFGGTGGLEASSDENLVTAQSSIGAREKTVWTAGTTGFIVAKTITGLQYELNAVISGANQITITFINQFAPDQIPVNLDTANNGGYTPPSGLLSYWTSNYPQVPQNQITVSTVNPGSPSASAIAILTFNSYGIVTKPYFSDDTPYSAGFLDYATSSNNDRGFVSGDRVFHPISIIGFSLDGFSQLSYVAPQVYSPIVPFLSANTPEQNLKAFINKIANPFQYTILVNSVPSAGEYILYSDETTDFTGYFTVDGSGTDPAIPGRTSVPFPIFSGYDVNAVAKVMADTINSFEFSLPSPTDLPALVPSSKVSWYINL